MSPAAAAVQKPWDAWKVRMLAQLLMTGTGSPRCGFCNSWPPRCQSAACSSATQRVSRSGWLDPATIGSSTILAFKASSTKFVDDAASSAGTADMCSLGCPVHQAVAGRCAACCSAPHAIVGPVGGLGASCLRWANSLSQNAAASSLVRSSQKGFLGLSTGCLSCAEHGADLPSRLLHVRQVSAAAVAACLAIARAGLEAVHELVPVREAVIHVPVAVVSFQLVHRGCAQQLQSASSLAAGEGC